MAATRCEQGHALLAEEAQCATCGAPAVQQVLSGGAAAGPNANAATAPAGAEHSATGSGAPTYPPAQAYPPAGYGTQAYPPAYPPAGYGAPTFAPAGANGLALPPGVELAGIGRRIGAWFLSFLLVTVTLGIGYVIWGLVLWGQGQTPTQKVLGMRCFKLDTGRPATWGTMALREIIGCFVQGLVGLITELISFIMMLTRSDRRCMTDLIAGTVVVYDPNKVLAP
ncbi:MAG: RDD family protein [Actinomycetota bacterium]|nr:RDD family protein [Actinomycetota bacterium]